MNILVTGAAGALGRNLVENLKAIRDGKNRTRPNLQIDKITVWDTMGGGNGEGSTTANFLSNIMKAVPPLSETLKMAGIKMPEYLGKEIEPAPSEAPSEE